MEKLKLRSTLDMTDIDDEHEKNMRLESKVLANAEAAEILDLIENGRVI